ncbi:nitrate reductase formation protein NapD [[Flexibacter] sp. ATCC 35103]|nr:nitrate reductase formation protein NapD [[Flexibacter] sp. ATCC 35103]
MTTDPKDSTATVATSSDPLPSWNDTALKKDIIAYVTKVTKEGSPDFIPVENRIATFDNDGTLWAEKPYVQELFAFYRVKKMVEANPELAKKQPFKAVVEKDKTFFEKGGDKALIELVAATHTGMTEDEFEASAKDFFATAQYPGKNVPVKQIRYQPQLELLNYLRANGFKTFIVTGGTIELVRAISADFYGIPKEQVVGTSFKYKFDDTKNAVLREPALDLFNDKEGKPVGIQLHIGQRPVFACGNEGGAGDLAMLRYSQGSKYPSFQLIVNHNDPIREYNYQEKDNLSLNTAAKYKYHVVSIKDDWKKIFPDK